MTEKIEEIIQYYENLSQNNQIIEKFKKQNPFNTLQIKIDTLPAKCLIKIAGKIEKEDFKVKRYSYNEQKYLIINDFKLENYNQEFTIISPVKNYLETINIIKKGKDPKLGFREVEIGFISPEEKIKSIPVIYFSLLNRRNPENLLQRINYFNK